MLTPFSGLDIVADKALIGFLKVLVEINRDSQVLGYREDTRLAGVLAPFKLRMGFGLHAGWAIEGAVGSLQKVDATYLSPHVNMAARMEAASRQFGVAILMTERFHEVGGYSFSIFLLQLSLTHSLASFALLCITAHVFRSASSLQKIRRRNSERQLRAYAYIHLRCSSEPDFPRS